MTLNRAQPSAQALATCGDKIHCIGSNREVSSPGRIGTTTIDLKGATVLPGFIDCHTHLVEYGLSLRRMDLRDVRSIEDIKKRILAKLGEDAHWIVGLGWDQEKFAERRYPTRRDLDEVTRDKPILLRRICGHICVVNSAALALANITSMTPDPEGGMIDRDTLGEPTGILRETAVELVERKIPDPTPAEYESATLAACRKAAEAGLTTVHCIVGSDIELRTLLRLKNERRLTVRFYLLIPVSQLNAAKKLGVVTGFGDKWIRFGAVKIFTDGSLGARTAALEQPYQDDPENKGVAIYSQGKLDEIVADAHASGFQVAVHAIGDRATRMALESLGKVNHGTGQRHLRHRIEHASVLNRELIRRLKRTEVIVTVQPHFVVSDFWVDQRLGPERARFTYPFRSLLGAGLVVVGSSDCPVEPLSPLTGIGAAVDRDGPEAVVADDAVLLYTRNAAYASFEEHLKGTIAPGKYADLVVLEKDPCSVHPREISAIRVLMTIVGGRVVYRSPILQ